MQNPHLRQDTIPASEAPNTEGLSSRIAALEAVKRELEAERDRLRDEVAALRGGELRRLLAVEAAGVGDWIFEVATGELRCSPRALEMQRLAADSRIDLSGHLRLIHPEDREQVRQAVERALDPRGDGRYRAGFRFLFGDGEVRWIDSIGRAVFAGPAEPRRAVQLVGAMIDVTERRKAEAELREARDAAERASVAKSQFLSTISHELRTPLTAVIGLADLMATEVVGPMNAKQREHLSRIQTSAWHLVAIIDEILTFSRSEAGKEAVRLTRVDLAEIARGVVGMLADQAQSRGLALRLHGADGRVVVTTDGGKARQILVNLVGNALRYTADGAVDVELDAGEESVELRVRDTGPGIAPERIEEIFEPFVQVDGPATREQGGTGLGLTIARRLSRLLGGDVTVESVVGEGSTFTIRLPRHAAVRADGGGDGAAIG